MAGTSLLALIDDIASVLDDVAAMTKVAARKTTGVLGDDLALNAQQVSGIAADRELPVVWAVAKGSLINKAILVPMALAISAAVPWAVTPLMMLGGAFLCFEGFEKLAHKLMHGKAEEHAKHVEEASADASIDMVAFERDKIKGAIRTDFILSAEIVVITLGLVAQSPFATQVAVLAGISVLMTIGVYGLVAGIVKLDDAGLYLSRKTGMLRTVGEATLAAAPYLMRSLSVIGTAAMFTVGGGILVHGIPGAHTLYHAATHAVAAFPAFGGLLATLLPMVLDAVGGVVAGVMVLGVVQAFGKLRPRQ